MLQALSSGASIKIHETLDSTNREARRRVDRGESGPLWIVALEQTAGYGRRGSPWVQARGDFAGTLLFAPDAPAEALPELSFVAALAAGDVVASLVPGADIALKWPNDVLAEGRKIAGLLLELLKTPDGSNVVALGIGLNVVSKPADAEYPAACLADFLIAERLPAPAGIAAALDGAFAAWLTRWRAEGFSPVRDAWLKRAARKGEKIRVRLPQETLEGVFLDLDPSGALVLDCEGRRRLIAAGQVLR